MPNRDISDSFARNAFERVATEGPVYSDTGPPGQAILGSSADGVFERTTIEASVRTLSSFVNDIFERTTTEVLVHSNTTILDSFIDDTLGRITANKLTHPDTIVLNSFARGRSEHITTKVSSGTGTLDKTTLSSSANDIFGRTTIEASARTLNSLVNDIFERAAAEGSIRPDTTISDSFVDDTFGRITANALTHSNTILLNSFARGRSERIATKVPSGTGALDKTTLSSSANDIFGRTTIEASACMLNSLVNDIFERTAAEGSIRPDTTISDSFVDDTFGHVTADTPVYSDAGAPNQTMFSSFVNDIFERTTTNTTTSDSFASDTPGLVAANTLTRPNAIAANTLTRPNVAIPNTSTRDWSKRITTKIPSSTGALDRATLISFVNDIFERTATEVSARTLSSLLNDIFERTLDLFVSDIFERALSSFINNIFKRVTPEALVHFNTILDSFVNNTPGRVMTNTLSCSDVGMSSSLCFAFRPRILIAYCLIVEHVLYLQELATPGIALYFSRF